MNRTRQIKGKAKRDVLRGSKGKDNINGLAGNDKLLGLAGNDRLNGGLGKDFLDGGKGRDVLKGGKDDDTYVVDNVGDKVKEAAKQGVDTVLSSVNYVLGAHLENLTLTGKANLNGTGNALANKLVGNSGDNILDGGIGADVMSGGLGNDTYFVDNLADIIIEQVNGGTDTVKTIVSNYARPVNVEVLQYIGQGNFTVNGGKTSNTIKGGNQGNNIDGGDGDDNISGGNGNDILTGGLGIDKLIGGLGNDIYSVDNIADVVEEVLNSGVDLVKSTVDYVLADNVENLELLGGNLNGTGNALDNIITGTAGNNILDGGLGNDTLLGGLGNDTLIGGAGLDTLTGGAGIDTFVLRALDGDVIKDFNPTQDVISLDKTAFKLLTLVGNVLGLSEFSQVSDDATAALGATLLNPTAKVIYSAASGKLFYDENGLLAGLGQGGQIAKLENGTGLAPVISAANFVVKSIV
jgi:Ca2+-binding RTX toxin-like protein